MYAKEKNAGGPSVGWERQRRYRRGLCVVPVGVQCNGAFGARKFQCNGAVAPSSKKCFSSLHVGI